MLGRTHHLPLASGSLSVLATQRILITSDMKEEEGKQQKKRVFLALCVLGDESNVKALLSCRLYF